MRKLVSALARVDGLLFAVQKVLILAGVAAMVAINGAQVFCRYVLHGSLAWSEQVSVLLFFILIMLGANLAVKSDTETKIDILSFRREKINVALHAVTDLICIVVLAVFLALSWPVMRAILWCFRKLGRLVFKLTGKHGRRKLEKG